MRLDRVVVADGVQPGVGVGVEVARLLAAGGVGAQRLEQAHLAGRGKEQLRVRDRGHALPAGGGGEVLRVRPVRKGVAKVRATLGVAGVLGDALVLAVGRRDVQLAVVEVHGGAGFLRDLLQAGGVQADELVTKVHIELEVAHVRVHGDLVRRDGRQVDGAPLGSGELHEDPGLGAVRDDDLVAVVAALLVDDLAQQLHAVARGIGAAQHDVGNRVLADAGGVVALGATGVDVLELFDFVARGQRGRDAHALLVGAGLGVRVIAIVPAGGKVTHVRVSIRRALERPLEV